MIQRVIISFGFLLTVFISTAQTMPFIKATADKNRILIGEPVLLTIEAVLPAGKSSAVVNLDTLDHFELLSPPVIDSSVSDQIVKLKADYRITSFDSGKWVIPAAALLSDIKIEPVEIEVVFAEFNPAQDYHDIKDVLDIKPSKKKIPWWWIAGTGLVMLIIGLLFYYGRKRKESFVPQNIISIADPYKDALAHLAALKTKQLSGKEFHTELSAIFRLYVYRKKGILSLQKTTDDLILQLKNLQLQPAIFEKMAQALRLGDFVKFAKYQPTNEDDIMSFESISATINSIQQNTETDV